MGDRLLVYRLHIRPRIVRLYAPLLIPPGRLWLRAAFTAYTLMNDSTSYPRQLSLAIRPWVDVMSRLLAMATVTARSANQYDYGLS